MEIRNAKSSYNNNNADDNSQAIVSRVHHYNKNGLSTANENFQKLPFIETQQVSDFEVNEHDENEDIEREVFYPIFHGCFLKRCN